MKLVVTGGAGFIGSCFVRMALREGWAEQVVNLDKLTYAGNLENLEPVADHPGYRFRASRYLRQRSRGAVCSRRNRPMRSFTSPPNRTWTAAFIRLLP